MEGIANVSFLGCTSSVSMNQESLF